MSERACTYVDKKITACCLSKWIITFADNGDQVVSVCNWDHSGFS